MQKREREKSVPGALVAVFCLHSATGHCPLHPVSVSCPSVRVSGSCYSVWQVGALRFKRCGTVVAETVATLDDSACMCVAGTVMFLAGSADTVLHDGHARARCLSIAVHLYMSVSLCVLRAACRTTYSKWLAGVREYRLRMSAADRQFRIQFSR
jgi:hypothetical protein